MHLLGGWKCKVFAKILWLVVREQGRKTAGMLTDLDSLVWKTKVKFNGNTDRNSLQNRRRMKYQILRQNVGFTVDHKLNVS